MTATPALIAPVATPIHKPLPTGLLKSCLTIVPRCRTAQETATMTSQVGTGSGSWAWNQASYLIRLGFALGIPVGIGVDIALGIAVDIALGIAVVASATASMAVDQFW